MAQLQLDTVYEFNAALLNLTGTLIVTSFTEEPGQLLIADGPEFDSGDTGATYGGAPADYFGGGTATVGITLPLIGTVNLGNTVDVYAFTSGGSAYFYYPGGEPSELLGDLATQLLGNPLIGTVMGLLGLSGEGDLIDYLEENALLTFNLDPNTAFPICLTRGTLVLTPYGERPVEELRVGDLVITADNGPQPVLWIGRRRVAGFGRMAPVRIEAGALGNARTLLVSQQHRMLVSHWRAQLYFARDEVLAPARSLTDGKRIRIEPKASVEYVHLFFERHQVIFAEGCATESFLPGPTAVGACDAAARAELLEIFPEAATPEHAGYQAARSLITMREGMLLAH